MDRARVGRPTANLALTCSPRSAILWRLLVALVVSLAPVRIASAQSAGCSFTLGFETLHDLIPDVVGGCLDNESHDPHTGDALQHTANGLLVWRKSDNWTAFTNGYQTFVNGPLGLEQRLNTQRLWWEANPDHLPIVPTPQPGERCHTAGLDLSLVNIDAGAGNRVGTFRLTNNLSVDCTFFGFPGAQLLDAAGNPLPTKVVRAGGLFTNDPPPMLIDVQPQAAGVFRIHWGQVPVDNEPTCPQTSSLAVTPPDEYVSLTLAIQIQPCGGGRLDMSAVVSN
jgi:hypothetical protein